MMGFGRHSGLRLPHSWGSCLRSRLKGAISQAAARYLQHPTTASGGASPQAWKRFCTALLAGFVLISPVSIAPIPAQAQGNVFPSLKPNPVVRGAQITFGDIFTNAGSAAALPLARAPGPGQRVVFGAPSLQARANAAGVRWTNREGVREIVINGTARVSTTSIPPSSTPDSAPTTIAVLSRAIARGAAIEAGDVIWMDAPAATPRDAIADPDALIGKSAKRALAANTPLRAADVMETPAVKRGEMVTLLFEAGGLRLSVRGRAMADAPVGAIIKVLNPQSNKTLDAMVESQGVARVLSSQQSGRVVAQIGAN
jgi:flagellar basal body P-ring formation protein FlgA